MGDSWAMHVQFEKKFPEREKAPAFPVWEKNLRLARERVEYKVREPKWLEREDPRLYNNLQSLRRHVLNGDDHAIKFCVKQGVDLNKPFPDGGGPALVEVASKGDVKLVRTLLDIKASPTGRNAHGYSPLMAAIDGSHWETAGLILAHVKPMDIAVQTKSNLTALKAVSRRRKMAEAECKELSTIIMRGDVPPHLVGGVVAKVEAAKAERERASLFLQDLMTIVDTAAKKSLEEKLGSSPRSPRTSTTGDDKAGKVVTMDSEKKKGPPSKSASASEGRWWLAKVTEDRPLSLPNPRIPKHQ